MPRLLLSLSLAASFLACSPSPPPLSSAPLPAPLSPPSSPSSASASPEVPPGEQLDRFAAAFLEAYLSREPVRATELGDHRFDDRWPDVSTEGAKAWRAWVQEQQRALEAIPDQGLSLQERIDKEITLTQLRSWMFSADELRPMENDPLSYTALIGDGLDPLINREFAPLEVRHRSLLARLKGIPALLAAARARLGTPPAIHTDTAIQQNKGLIALCETELPRGFSRTPALQEDLNKAAQGAAAALREFQTFLEKELRPRSTGDFRLGRARFEKKLRGTLDDDVDIDALARDARELMARTQDEMLATSRELWPALFKGKPWKEPRDAAARRAAIKQTLDALAEDRPSDKTIVKEAEQQLAEATAFVRKHDLVRVPDEPCRVIEMPEYRRGVAVAYCDSSGPLEEKQETFYAIAPTPRDWDAKRVTSFYREYNRSMLNDLTVHEAMPGHFLQLMHSNRFPSRLRAVFQSGPFVEGWAVYAEWLMAKYGYGGPKVRLSRQKMVLRLCANTLLDHGIHAGSMDEAQALALMKEEAFQEDGEAIGKWRRARLTSAQLTTYFYGFTGMMRIREAHEKLPGFQERAFHDRLLASGSPPVRHARALMAPPPLTPHAGVY